MLSRQYFKGTGSVERAVPDIELLRPRCTRLVFISFLGSSAFLDCLAMFYIWEFRFWKHLSCNILVQPYCGHTLSLFIPNFCYAYLARN